MFLMFLFMLLFTLTPGAFTPIALHFRSCCSYSSCDSISLLMHLIFTHGVFAIVVLGVLHFRSYSSCFLLLLLVFFALIPSAFGYCSSLLAFILDDPSSPSKWCILGC
jgi:hypothetical protein